METRLGYSGNTTDRVDKVLAKYYKKTIEMYELKYQEMGVPEWTLYARQQAYSDMVESWQGLEANFNSVLNARGTFPFTTFSFGDVRNEYEADVCKAILEVKMKGHGLVSKEIQAFPKLVFLKNPLVHDVGKEYRWLYELALKCSASGAMYPDMIGAYSRNHCRVAYANEQDMIDNGINPEWYNLDIKELTLEQFDLMYEWVSPMGCRAYLSDYFDPITKRLVFTGRLNIGAVSLHLPLIFMLAKRNEVEFFKLLMFYLEMIRKVHINRYAYLGKARASSNPLMFCEGGAYGGNLKKEDYIEPILKSATASFGITCLHELQMLYNGKRLSEDNSFAKKTVLFIKDAVNKFKEEDGHLYALYGTPAESLCGTQREQFVNNFGIIEGVSDKLFMTNSFHCHVTDEITPMEKQDKEEEIFQLISGGHIQYVRVSDPNNLEALDALITRGLEKGFYQGVNYNSCVCIDCGHRDNDIGETCPICGSKNITEMNRTCGYMGFSRRCGDNTYNDAKQQEVDLRGSM